MIDAGTLSPRRRGVPVGEASRDSAVVVRPGAGPGGGGRRRLRAVDLRVRTRRRPSRGAVRGGARSHDLQHAFGVVFFSGTGVRGAVLARTVDAPVRVGVGSSPLTE